MSSHLSLTDNQMLDPDFNNSYRSAGAEVDVEGSYINPSLINPTAAGWTPSTLSDARTTDPGSDPITSAIMSGVKPPKMPTVRHKMTKEEKAERKQEIGTKRRRFYDAIEQMSREYREQTDYSDLMDRHISVGQESTATAPTVARTEASPSERDTRVTGSAQFLTKALEPWEVTRLDDHGDAQRQRAMIDLTAYPSRGFSDGVSSQEQTAMTDRKLEALRLQSLEEEFLRELFESHRSGINTTNYTLGDLEIGSDFFDKEDSSGKATSTYGSDAEEQGDKPEQSANTSCSTKEMGHHHRPLQVGLDDNEDINMGDASEGSFSPPSTHFLEGPPSACTSHATDTPTVPSSSVGWRSDGSNDWRKKFERDCRRVSLPRRVRKDTYGFRNV